MDDINEYYDSNLGGVLCFKFIPVNDVESIDFPISHQINTPVVLKTDKRWFNAYATFGTIGFTELADKTPSGETYKVKLTAVIPKDETDKANLFNLMRNQRFIVDYKDANGLRKLVGSIEEPLFFTSELNTKTEVSGRNEHVISFYGEQSHKAYIYNY